MAIYPIQNEPIPVNTYRIVPNVRQGGTGRDSVQEIGDVTGKDSPFPNHSTWAELEKINELSNEIAQKARTDDMMLDKLGDYIDRMKAQLERIIKNFPPFPPGSEERINLLRGYAAFRKLIDQLTIPPPENPAAAETSRVLSPGEPLPGADGTGERTLGNLRT
jgi:hypothetical protein